MQFPFCKTPEITPLSQIQDVKNKYSVQKLPGSNKNASHYNALWSEV